MKIYIAHSSSFNYLDEIYTPIRKSELNTKHEITLPHETVSQQFNSKEYFDNCDLVIAEVSFPSTGMGIELGWANLKNIKIVCVHKKGSEPSIALTKISNKFIEYSSPEDLVSKLESEMK